MTTGRINQVTAFPWEAPPLRTRPARGGVFGEGGALGGVIAFPRPGPGGALRGGGARGRTRVRSRCCSLSAPLSSPAPRGRVGGVGSRARGGPGPARLAASPKAPRSTRRRGGGGCGQQRLPLGEAVPSGCTARFGAGDLGGRCNRTRRLPRSGDGSGFACFRLCGSLSSAPPTRGPDRSRQLAGGRL